LKSWSDHPGSEGNFGKLSRHGRRIAYSECMAKLREPESSSRTGLMVTGPGAVVGRRIGFLAAETCASGKGQYLGGVAPSLSLSFINATTMTRRRLL